MTLLLTPKSHADWLAMRAADVTSTEVAALFGDSPYLTRFELWHAKRGTLQREFEATERMKWGTRLEPAIAAGIAEDQGWTVKPLKVYARHATVERMGSSFDFEVDTGDGRRGILEIKNVDWLVFKNEWGDGTEAPVHIEWQVQHQLEVMAAEGYEFAYICALVGGNEAKLIYRERDPEVGHAIRAAVREFWRTVNANEEPAPDFARDHGSIRKLYGHAEPGKVLDLRGTAGEGTELSALVAAYKAAGKAIETAEAAKDAARAQILTIIGDAEKVIHDEWSISAGLVGPKTVSYTAEGYRSFRVTAKKAKAGAA